MAAHESIAFFAALLSQSLDIVIPSIHGLVSFSTENPGVPAVHGSSLATFDDKLV
jgi:hypothetical protein